MAEFAVVQQAARTGTTGTQDFTVSGFGTPKAALFFLSYGVTAGTAVSHAMLSVGATDGTNSRAMAWAAEDTGGTTDTGSTGSTTAAVITLLNTIQSTIDGTANFQSWITDGVRIDWTDVPPSAYLITCVLIGGSGVSNCAVGSVTSSGVVDSAVTVTPGWGADFVFTWSMAENSGTSGSNSTPSIGIVVNDGSNTQRSVSQSDVTASGTSTVAGMVDTNSVTRRAISGAGGVELQINNFTSTSFDVVQKVSASTALVINYLAVNLASGLEARVVTSASPTVTGNHSITGLPWKPQFGLMLHSSALAVDTVYTDGNAEAYGISAFTASAAGCSATCSDDGVVANTESITNNTPVSLRKDAAEFMTASFSAFTNDGVTFNYSATDGSARQRAVLFVEQGSSSLAVDSGSYSLVGLDTVLRNTATTWLRLRK